MTVDSAGAVHIPAITVPFSSYASPEAKKAFLAYQQFITTVTELVKLPMPEQRRREAERLRQPWNVQKRFTPWRPRRP